MSMGWSTAEDELRQELDPGERLLWAGQPRQGLRLQTSDFVMIPASLMWGGFAIAWEVMAFAIGAPIFFKLWGIPFVLVGLYIMVGRFFFDARRRARTFYGLTDRSLLLITGGRRRMVRRFDLTQLGPISLQEHGDGSGVLSFGALVTASAVSNPMAQQLIRMAGRNLNGGLPYLEVQEDVRGVYRRVRDAIEAAENARQAD
jgi:hypothetical protein